MRSFDTINMTIGTISLKTHKSLNHLTNHGMIAQISAAIWWSQYIPFRPLFNLLYWNGSFSWM